ncbi:hypothetical protein CKO23_02210 [Thiocystis violacea]|nr:hypothetical protein [Thiocystis violacea]
MYAVIVALSLVAGVAPNAFGATITFSKQAGTIASVSEVRDFRTNGAMMDGMQVTAYFSASGAAAETSEVLSWADIDAVSGGVSGAGWSLRQSGDTFDASWTLNMNGTATASITRLVIDAGTGNSVFDLTRPSMGTSGSSQGRTFSLGEGQRRGLSVTYSDLVALDGQSPVGDLYRRLTIDFQDGALFGPGQSLSFLADTDNILTQSAMMAPVPIPAAAWLFGSGLLGLIMVRRGGRQS